MAKQPVVPAKDYAGSTAFCDALKKIATASTASSHAAIEAAKATKPSRHTRFVYAPSKGQV